MCQHAGNLPLVFVKRTSKIFLTLICLFGLNTFAEDHQDPSIDISDELESINYEILDLEVSYEMGEDTYDINLDVKDIQNELLFHEYQIGTPKDENSNWNESEQMILEAKIKLQALQEKIKVEGDWGQLRFRIVDFKGEDPGQVKLRYNYGF